MAVLAVGKPFLLGVVFAVEDQSELIFLEEARVVEVVGLGLGVVGELRPEERVEGKSEHVFEHSGDEAFEGMRGELEARVCVDFDEEGPEARVHQKIQSEELEAVVLAVGIEPVKGRGGNVEGDAAHDPVEAVDAVVLLAELGGEVAFELRVAQFVSLLVLAVLIAVLLDCVVGEVHEPIAQVLQAVEEAGCLDVALLVEVKLESAVDVHRQQVGPNVELPAVVQEGVFDVLLNNQLLLALQPLPHFPQGPRQSYPLPSVGVLRWLQDPQAVEVF